MPQAASGAKLDPENFTFANELRNYTTTFVMKSFTAFVKLFCTVDTDLPSDIRAKSGDMIGLGFAV